MRRVINSRRMLVGLTAAAVAVAGCGSGAAGHAGAGSPARVPAGLTSQPAAAGTPSPPLPAGQQGSRQQIPWAQVGPGWFLAEWSPAATPVPATLFLIDPSGGRYLIETFPASPSASTPTILAGWSGDGERALLKSQNASTPGVAAVLDLRTLATTQFQLASNVYPSGFTAPDGLAIIANVLDGPMQARLERLSLTGQPELSYPASFPGGRSYSGSALYSPDGTRLAGGTSGGIELMSNAGDVLRFLPVVDPAAGPCTAVRWWTSEELLVGCGKPNTQMQQLWLVPASGATPTALTASSPAPPDDGGVLNAWPLSAGVYVTDLTGCGQTYVAKLRPDGQTAPVSVPGLPSADSTTILGSQGDRLAISSGVAPVCGTVTKALLWYTPATDSVTTLLGGTVNGGIIQEAIMFRTP